PSTPSLHDALPILEPLLELRRTVAPENEMGVAVDQAGGYPGAAQRLDLLRLVSGQLGALADAHDPPVLDADRAILDRAERGRDRRVHRRDMAIDQQQVPHVSLSPPGRYRGRG